jgi:hypothetical protein
MLSSPRPAGLVFAASTLLPASRRCSMYFVNEQDHIRVVIPITFFASSN